jgi:hypothetical protein
VFLQVSLTQARIDMSELDEDSDGFLQPHVWTPQHMLTKLNTLEDFFHALIILIGNRSIYTKTHLVIFIGNGSIYKRAHP